MTPDQNSKLAVRMAAILDSLSEEFPSVGLVMFALYPVDAKANESHAISAANVEDDTLTNLLEQVLDKRKSGGTTLSPYTIN